ncbi:MAG: methyltransferase domain-containing protein, partial [Patescibacteria group bacterium]
MMSPSFQQQRAFYERLWNGWRRLYIDEKCRKRFVLAALAKIPKRPLQILDAGCGRGWLTEVLSHYGSVVGVDLFVQEARKRYPKLAFREANIALRFPKGTYDVVVSSEVIEHFPVEHQAEHIKNIARALSQGGRLILTTPNKRQMESLTSRFSDTSYLQPLENWLDREELMAILEPYFTIQYFGSARFYPVFLFSFILLRAPYHVFYDYLGGYWLLD